ncbi:HEAT repeat domain-containing protein [Rathayibacter tanaceti]|uniref:HEAT repeat domain-containing protein n=2 Tax=Rathayibacter tanaceti TaxID=1671680 RepID=A0A166HRI9_9MICO|nr:HEAT repeat domain-containing protein [Rathayibacter tanaceti]KZX21054.1 hypothetical protein ACH61_01839 [Rathayibacter tanaceti]QHC56331.1 HEAT repeat domain-containing protein [Rathayibacter tanaceti]TCO34854.1 HEAT repeat protein [Rathayibacter tanaceti]
MSTIRPSSDSTQPGRHSGDQVARLLAGLADRDRDVRQASALALGERADRAAVGAVLAQLWEEPDFFVRDTLTWAASRVGREAVPLVREALAADRRPAVRTQAMHVLSKIADPATMDDILPLIDDGAPEVAAKARWALSRLGDPRAVPVLLRQLGTGDAEAQNALTDVVASFRAAAVPGLIDALAHADPAARRHAAEVVGHIGSPHAEPALAALRSAAEGPDVEVAVSALMAVGEFSSHEAQLVIADATQSGEPRVRAVAERLRSRPPRRSRLETLQAVRAARQAGAS